ncbi:MAG: L-threonine 3-dehydrogenase [Calditrichaeota bacterium]|nr:MAG: L-threonine 3-dehydrogenase [Calditrichota bacterium]
MKALVKKKAEPGLWLEQMPIPKIGNNDLLVKIIKTAICGTDLHIYKWDEWSQRTIKIPQIIGHEFVGEIVEIGKDVRGYQVGERVSGEGHIVCGVCRSCRAGRRHLCTKAVGIGVNRDGCFAEYLSLPASNAWHVHPSISSDIAAFFDPYGNAAHAALSFDLVGEDVLITGAGPIGIMSVAIAKHVGARNVVITDVNDYRLNLAQKMGATRTVNVAQTSLRVCREEMGLYGFDIGLEMSGNRDAFESMLENMYHGGRIALLGILPNTAQVDWDQVIFKGLTIKGIYGREIFETWYKMQTMLQSGLDISPVLTHKVAFEDFQKGFDAMLSGNSGKVVLELE